MISVGRILEGAFGVFREHFTAVAIWAGIYLAGNIAMLLTMAPMMTAAMDPATAADPNAVMAAMGPVWLLNLVLALVGVVLYTAAMRSVLRPDAGGLAFLRVGMDELRMIVLTILFFIGSVILFFLASLVLGLFGAGVAMGSESPALTFLVSLLIGLVVFGLAIYFIIRFSLAFPLTLHRGEFVIGEAWRLSRGHFWTLFGAALVVVVIGFILSMIVGIFSMGSYFADILAAAGNPDATMLAAERQAERLGSFSVMMILQSVGGAVVAAVWVALSGGSAAAAARLLVEDEFDDAEEVFG
ncbi:hypothetical protein OK349_12920 [Sphingomonas sp. BT-65]|uniref:hypothetical protein n=1 Tax=Sphingomonas sp. BT-65 TaxID=2989821 RepID=UPI00223632AF|nr:hypothetical protein [Sphingomonas sp. BT-65]MCW4462612.1 hypothetical protein [Sphingomonas sp. BT-65]